MYSHSDAVVITYGLYKDCQGMIIDVLYDGGCTVQLSDTTTTIRVAADQFILDR